MFHQLGLLGSTHCRLCDPWPESCEGSTVAATIVAVHSNISRFGSQGPGRVRVAGLSQGPGCRRLCSGEGRLHTHIVARAGAIN